jgi:integrase
MRRKTTAIPSPVTVRGRARIRLDGRTFYLGAVGSPEARRLEDRIVGAWLANGRRLPDDFDPRATTSSSVAPEAAAATPVAAATVAPPPAPLPPAPPPGPEAAGGELTVGELCQRWLAWIKAERLTPGQDTSILHGAKQATYALRRHWAMRAGDFGPRALAEVRAALANEPIRVVNRKPKAKAATATPSKRAKPKPPKPPKPPRYRARSTVVDTVGRVRQLFRWAVSRELVAPDRVHALASLEALLPGQTKAVEREPVKAVPDDVFNATLAKLPPIMADLLRVCRLTGSRPGEVCRLIVRHIDMRGEVWTYAPPKHKNAWRGHSRNVEIGPRAQAILRRYIGNRSIDAPLFSPRESEELRGRKPGRHHRDHYDDCQVCRAVTRACEKHGIQRWTPYQLRHSRLEEVREAFSLDHAQAVGGQKHVRVTEIYAPVKRSKAQEVAKLTG